MPDDSARRLILARRARFVAAAMASVATALAGAEACSPEPCLTMPAPANPDASDDDDGGDAEAGPQPCLSIDAEPPTPDDAGDDGGPSDGGTTDADAGE